MGIKRIKSFYIDTLAISIVALLFCLFEFSFSNTKEHFVNNSTHTYNVFLLLVSLPFMSLLFKDIDGGVSIGKLLQGLKIVDRIEEKPNFLILIGRNLPLSFFYIESLYYIIYRKRFGDFLFKTEVVESEKVENLNWELIRKLIILILVNFLTFIFVSFFFKTKTINPNEVKRMELIEKNLLQNKSNEIDSCNIVIRESDIDSNTYQISAIFEVKQQSFFNNPDMRQKLVTFVMAYIIDGLEKEKKYNISLNFCFNKNGYTNKCIVREFKVENKVANEQNVIEF